MINPNLEIPSPSKFVSFKTVDSIALQLNQLYRSESKNKQGYPLDCERLADWLELSLYSDKFDEPEGASFFAGLAISDGETVYINEKHRQLFDQRPDVYAICLGHEIGHATLQHLNHPSINQDLPLFPEDNQNEQFMLHSSSWFQYGLPKEEVERRKNFSKQIREDLVLKAGLDSQARQELRQLDEKFEPDWMFKQAEHFAKCLCIPQDKLYEMLEIMPLMKGWRSVYRLAEAFQISPSVMKSRLVNLNLIEIGLDNQPIPIPQNNQKNLF
jgi:Zn-dependent peptidase ImmA (M78 family)